MGIGQRKKKKMEGTSSYKRIKPIDSQPSPPSPKRIRIRYKREGGIPSIPKHKDIPSPDQTDTSRKSVRYAIYYFWLHDLDGPHEVHWSGKDGTIAHIQRSLKMPTHTQKKIRRTLEEIMRCLRLGLPFDGKIHSDSMGRKVLISAGLVEETLIANWMEQHCGFRMTTMLVNEHRAEQGDERVSVWAVMSAFYRLKPKINLIQKVQSGGLNPAWIEASYNTSKQMQIMLGRIINDEVMTDSQGNALNPIMRITMYLSLQTRIELNTISDHTNTN